MKTPKLERVIRESKALGKYIQANYEKCDTAEWSRLSYLRTIILKQNIK